MSTGKRFSGLRSKLARATSKATDKTPQTDEKRAAGKRRAAASKRPGEGSETGKRTAAGDARRVSDLIAAAVLEVGKLVREVLVIPAQLFMAVAEIAGAAVLVVWRRVGWPLALAVWAALRALYRLALRHVTPARAVLAVALVATACLAASQWVDYRGISVGNDAYTGDLRLVAPPPEVERAEAGEAHAWVMVPLALAALAALVFSVAGRPRAARLLVPLGAAVIAIAVIVDVPKGLDEGTAAIAYEGASARLLEGFWLQIASAATLIACGLLLPRYLRASPAPAPAPQPRGQGPLRKLAGKANERLQGRREKASERSPRRPRRRAEGARS
jgi:hypothetical protein